MSCQQQQSRCIEHSVGRLLLSHHPLEHIHRTIPLRCGQRRYQVCARCLGVLLGLLFFTGLWVFGIRVEITALALCPLVIMLVLPAVVDFNRQLVSQYESSNLRRLLTGGMYGYGLAWSVWSHAQGQWVPLLATAAVLAGGFAWLVLSRRRLVRLLQHLELYEQYFDRCRTEDTRRAAQERLIKV
jgi:uncharacterized membrane protein